MGGPKRGEQSPDKNDPLWSVAHARGHRCFAPRPRSASFFAGASSAEEERFVGMCGIFGYVGTRETAPQLVLAGLKKLEYRGYDSWGIAARDDHSARPRLLVDKHIGKIGQAST